MKNHTTPAAVRVDTEVYATLAQTQAELADVLGRPVTKLEALRFALWGPNDDWR